MKDPRFRVYSQVAAASLAIVWKQDHPLFRLARVRRALTLAINRRELLQLLNLPPDLPFGDGVWTNQQWSKGEIPELLPFDPAGAQALLASAGWLDRDGGGIRERDGRPFRFTAIVGSGLDMPRLAVDVQAHLRRVGVQMDIRVMDRSVVENQRIGAGDFEAAFIRLLPGDQKKFFGRGTISASWARWPTACWSCIRARLSSSPLPTRCSNPLSTPTRRDCWAPSSILVPDGESR